MSQIAEDKSGKFEVLLPYSFLKRSILQPQNSLKRLEHCGVCIDLRAYLPHARHSGNMVMIQDEWNARLARV